MVSIDTVKQNRQGYFYDDCIRGREIPRGLGR